MLDRIKFAREDKWWRAAEAEAEARRGNALERADASAAKVCREARLRPSTADTDAVLERGIARSATEAQRSMRMLACASFLTLDAVQRHAEKHLKGLASTPVPQGEDAVWILGVLAQRRPEAFGAQLGNQIARLPEGLGSSGAIHHAATLQGIVKGLQAASDASALKVVLLERIEAWVACRYPALAQLLTHHTWHDPALRGEMPVDAAGFHSLGLMRDFRAICLDAVTAGTKETLVLAEKMVQACGGFASDLLFEAAGAVLSGGARPWVDNWAYLTEMRQDEDWAGFMSWALSMYDQRESGDPVAYFVGNLISETVGNMRPLESTAFDTIDAGASSWVSETCERLMGIDDVWKRFVPPQLREWQPGAPRHVKIACLAEELGAHLDPAQHPIMGLVHTLLHTDHRQDLQPGGTFDTKLKAGRGIVLNTASQKFCASAQKNCAHRTLLTLRDTLGNYLIGHHGSAQHVALALALFKNTVTLDRNIDGHRVAAAGHLLARLPANALTPMLELAEGLQSGGGASSSGDAYVKVLAACDEMSMFYVSEWLCTGGYAEGLLRTCGARADGLRGHVAQRAQASWAPMHLGAWEPDTARLGVYASILRQVVPTIADATLRDKARNLLAFLIASEGPARAMQVTNWNGNTQPLELSPAADRPYTSMRNYCCDANLRTPRVVNVIVGDAKVVAHGELVPDISRFVALASDEIGRAMMATWQNVSQEQARRNLLILFEGILTGFACLDGWVTNLNEMMEKKQINLDGSSLDMVLDLQGKRDDHERCSEYLRVFRLQCGMGFREDSGLPKDAPMADFEESPAFIQNYCNAKTFEQHLERARFHATLSIPELIDHQVDVIGVLERCA